MKRLPLLAGIFLLTIGAAYPQDQGTSRQFKSGDVIHLSDSLSAKVTKSTASSFSKIKVKGEAVVVVLELEAGKKGVTMTYKLAADTKLSDIYLASGGQRIAPRAVLEDFPSWGKDNDKEVEVLDTNDKSGGVIITFDKKGSVALLFDVPLDQAKTPKTFSMVLRTVKPKDEKLSLVVDL